MTHTLFGARGSGSASVEAALVLAGLPFDKVEAAPWVAGSAMDRLRAANPLGQIPTLVWPDGPAMSESAAILAELGLRHPASGLLPTAPDRRAEALRGLVFIAANCYSLIGLIDYPDRALGPEPSKADAQRVVQACRTRLHAMWSQFADTFTPPEGQPFFDGDRPGGLDLLATVVSQWAGTVAHLAEHRPAMAAWRRRVWTHPAVQPVFAAHWPDVKP